MTVEEIEILVTAKVEEALKEFQKFLPAIKQTMKQSQEAFSKVDMKEFNKKVQQTVNFTKKKVQDLKKSSEKNKIAIRVNNEEAQKQITQIEKEIDSLQKKITGRQLKLNIANNALDKIRNDTNQSVIKEMPRARNKQIKQEINKKLDNDISYQNLVKQSDKLNNEVLRYNALLDSANVKLREAKESAHFPKITGFSGSVKDLDGIIYKVKQTRQEIEQTSTTQNKLSSFFGAFKQKIEQTKPSITSMKNSFSRMPKVTQNITNNIKNIGNGLKNGLGNILKYAGALLSLKSIYSTLSNSANTWLSSQNAQAKQLSANIEYMKYAMGSALAPIIQYVTSLVYQLMKAIQSVAYALTGVNIFAKASASAYASMAGNAKKAKNETKALAGIHNEINNISDNNSDSGSGGSVTPSFDLSGIDNTPNSIIDAIKNGNWYEVGSTIGQKLNDAMNSIPWESIQNTAKSIGTNIAQFLNGFIAKANWNQVGNTFAEGLNTVIYFGYNFVTNFDWKQFGKAIGSTINTFFANIDWKVLAQTVSKGIIGIFNTITEVIHELDWNVIINAIIDFFANVDYSGISNAFFEMLGSAVGSLVKLGWIIGEKLNELVENIANYFLKYIDLFEELGGNWAQGILAGIIDALVNLGNWIIEHVFKPFIDGFKNAFGIHSPSTVMAEMGGYLIEGLKQGLLNIWDKIKMPFIELGTNLSNKFNEIKENITIWTNNTKETVQNWGSNIKSKISESWSNASNTVKEKVTNLKNNISTGLNNAKATISNWGNNIKSTFTNLGISASTWGKDLATNMATGIKNNIHKVTNAVTSVANKIKSFLHFTEPDEGPLSNFHTYMPDMIDLMVSGIKSNTNKIKSEMENLAGTMSYTINAEAVTNIPSTNAIIKPINTQSSNMFSMLNDMMAYKEGDNDRPIYLTVKVGDRVLGEILLNDLRNKKRQTGKDIEAIIGD